MNINGYKINKIVSYRNEIKINHFKLNLRKKCKICSMIYMFFFSLII